MDFLTITRKIWTNPHRYQETVIKMFDQPAKTGLGRTLQVEDKVFEDLDELIIGYAISFCLLVSPCLCLYVLVCVCGVRSFKMVMNAVSISDESCLFQF